MESTLITGLTGLEIREADGGHELAGICVPYDTVTRKAGTTPELVRRGAFADAVSAAGKVRLFDHNHSKDGMERRPVGVAAALEERAAGLWGRFRFYNTPEGRAALENTLEETYGGLSIGFFALVDQVVGGIREIHKARLHHVSLVDEPAYEDARILAVRAAADEQEAELERYRRLAAPIEQRDRAVLDEDDTPTGALVKRMLGDVRTRP